MSSSVARRSLRLLVEVLPSPRGEGNKSSQLLRLENRLDKRRLIGTLAVSCSIPDLDATLEIEGGGVAFPEAGGARARVYSSSFIFFVDTEDRGSAVFDVAVLDAVPFLLMR